MEDEDGQFVGNSGEDEMEEGEEDEEEDPNDKTYLPEDSGAYCFLS